MKNLKQFIFFAITLLFVRCSETQPPLVTIPNNNKEKSDSLSYEFFIGSLFSFQKELRTGNLQENGNTTLYNLPLFSPPNTEEEWWDNLVEEFAYSGLDFAMANCRGILPDPRKYTDHGDPNRLKYLIEAMERRGVANKFKVAIFDDCPASWAAARNLDLYNSYVSNLPDHPYPIDQLDGENGIYKYIWDYNLKIAFQNVPDKYLFKYKNKPVVFFWSVNNFLDPSTNNNYYGKLSKIIKRIRADFNNEFGIDPFIVVDKSFCDRDYTIDYPIVDAVHNWFNMNQPYTMHATKGVTIGIGVPGFSVNDKEGNRMLLDANHGKLLNDALNGLIINKSDIILIEGFTDVLENASLWRSIDNKYYDYPNQRLNIVRCHSKDPYPKEFKVEAEGCDFYKDNTPGNSGGIFRKGDLDIKKCTDTYGGWCITETSNGEWLEWRELPMRAKISTFKIRYLSKAEAKICFNIDGKDGTIIDIPSSNNEWKTVDAGIFNFSEKGLHDIILKILSGNIDINYFLIVSSV